MSKLKEQVVFETTFDEYEVYDVLGEGGAGQVYGGMIRRDSAPIALKVLKDQGPSERRHRFKNEINFLERNRHKNIVTVLDNGIARTGKIKGPFYVMPRYDGSLRDLIKAGIAPSDVLPFFAQILDGVEAAHLQGVVHRDLKPENILYSKAAKILAIADFGIAHFTADLLATMVETKPTERLANFQYAAPEQRSAGAKVTLAADIYALGLILNELFTRATPHGTDYRQIGAVAPELAFLDPTVAQMIKQSADERPTSIAAVKQLIQKYRADAVSQQKLSAIDKTVIKASEIDDPLAIEPPRLVGVQWDNGTLKLTLDRPVSRGWVNALQNMGNYTSVYGKDPVMFHFSGDTTTIDSGNEQEAQQIINYFKAWLPVATRIYNATLETEAQQREAREKEQLRAQRAAEEKSRRINQALKI